MNYILAVLLSLASLTSYAQSEHVIGTTRGGDVVLRQSSSSFVLQFTDNNTPVNYTFADTSELRKGIDDVINERTFRVTTADATVAYAGKDKVSVTVPKGRVELTRQEYNELFGIQSGVAAAEPALRDSTTFDSTPVRVVRDTVYVAQVQPAPPTVEKKQKNVRFMWGFQLAYLANDELTDLGGHGGGFNLTFGVRIKKQFTAGLGGGVVATAVEDDEGELEFATHYPVYLELQYVGKWAVNPFVNVQTGIIMSSVEGVVQEDRNENTTFASIKGGVAFGRRSKFALFGGYSIINLADKSLGTKFLSAGIGFTF